jgi:hypothetical protein
VEHLTKWPEAFPIKEKDAQTVVGHLHEITRRYGAMKELISDRGLEFVNALVERYAKQYNIRLNRTTAYHPQSNGLTERMNKIIKNAIRRIGEKATWDLQLPDILYSIRTHVSATTGFTPFHLMYGKVTPEDPNKTFRDRIEQGQNDTQAIRNQAKGFIRQAQERQKTQYNKRRKDQHLEIGDWILIWRSMIETNFAAKLEPKWEGPYHIRRIEGTSIYLATADGEELYVPVHINRTKKYHLPPEEKETEPYLEL